VFRAVLSAFVGGILLYLAVPQIGPAVRAASADGSPGVFTAQRLDCVEHPGHRSCSWSGTFQANAGGAAAREVTLYGYDEEVLRPGMTAPAFDIGHADRVVGPDGSNEWMFTALLIAVAAGILYLGIGHPLLRLALRRTALPAGERGEREPAGRSAA
jgi:hypothetical protein